MLRAIVPVILAGLLAAPAAAQEKFTIKIRKDTKGDTTRITENDTEKGVTKVTFNGMTMPKDEDKTLSAAFTEKIVEKETGKLATKLERTYTKAEMSREGTKIAPSFVGKTVLIERANGKYKFSVGGKELDGDDAKFLNEEFKEKKRDDAPDIEDILLPTEAIAVNGAWKPDVAAIVKEFSKDANGLNVDIAKATASGKLLKAYNQDGKQFGSIEVVLTLPLKEVGAGAMKIVLENNSTAKITFRFDGCIDGTANTGKLTALMEMKMIGALKTNDGIEVKLDANLTKNSVKTQEPAK